MYIAISIPPFHTSILTTFTLLLLSKYDSVSLHLSCFANFCSIVHGIDIAKAKWQAKHINEPSSRSSNTNLFASARVFDQVQLLTFVLLPMVLLFFITSHSFPRRTRNGWDPCWNSETSLNCGDDEWLLGTWQHKLRKPYTESRGTLQASILERLVFFLCDYLSYGCTCINAGTRKQT